MSGRIVMAVLLLAACDSKVSGGGGGGAKVAESGTAKGSAGGFSATMSAELAKAGVGEPAIPPVTAPVAAAGSPAAGSVAAGSPAATGSGAPAAAGSAIKSTPIETPAPEITAAGSASTTAAPAMPDTSAKLPAASADGAVKAPANRAYVKPPSDVAAIKLELEPNWERDMGEAGTFSLVVKVPNTDDTRVFSVRYGYEDSAAPNDCDLYRKYLQDRGAMKVTLNRQSGGACYLEGIEQGGALAYRYLLTYGGRRLMCHGSLYKDQPSAALGDLRDKVLIQAKKICETLAL